MQILSMEHINMTILMTFSMVKQVLYVPVASKSRSSWDKCYVFIRIHYLIMYTFKGGHFHRSLLKPPNEKLATKYLSPVEVINEIEMTCHS